uniref:Uncharacterized protein LOC105054525 isoform X2 n=1 Tax=Elaeis guineensis var. tenera TaxID=51953 RepID=A0A6I9S6R1_ELAGV|nr:uncharacterized protein LOC105054525 isoform X2 [Elaeis guineensis]
MPLVLKDLYCLLLKLSPDASCLQGGFGDSTSLFVSSPWLQTRIEFAEIVNLSDLLFKELREQLEQLLPAVQVPPSLVAGEKKIGCEASPQAFLPLLRCCAIMLRFLEFDLSLVLERCDILLAVLRRLPAPNLPSHLHECARVLDGVDTEARVPRPAFCPAVLEVFIDEFLVQPQLRKHFIMTDYVSATTDKLLASHGINGDISAVQELVSGHFLLTYYHESTFSGFIHSLSWTDEVDDMIPELGLDAALTLLGSCTMFTLPPMLQAHLILLASRCIGVQRPTDNKPDDELMGRYILAFELSVKLYVNYTSNLDLIDKYIGFVGQSGSRTTKSLDSYLRSVTRNMLNYQIDKLVDFCHSHSQGMLSGTKADILSNSVAYIRGNHHVVDEMCRDETCLFLNLITLGILPGEIEESTSDKRGDKIQQEIYCLAAVLKLMSSALLQIVWNLRQNGCLHGVKTLKDYTICKEYDFILSIISCFGKYDANQLVQNILLDVMGMHPVQHEGAMLMLAHFVCLSSYSFHRRLGFLWKGCIFMMMTIMNLLLLEEGSLDAFSPSLSNMKDAALHHSPLEKSPKSLVHRRSSAIIASSLQNIQTLYLRDNIRCLTYGKQRIDAGERNLGETQDGQSGILSIIPTEDLGRHCPSTNEADTCNGEAFIECLPGYHKNPSEWDDLVDFIECKRGKDYSSWMRKRKRFRRWQHERRHGKKKFLKEVEAGARKTRSRKAM